ncbi:MAG: hypothetical protein ACI4SH_07535 [Candidatus Scatosoma sp.]
MCGGQNGAEKRLTVCLYVHSFKRAGDRKSVWRSDKRKTESPGDEPHGSGGAERAGERAASGKVKRNRGREWRAER